MMRMRWRRRALKGSSGEPAAGAPPAADAAARGACATATRRRQRSGGSASGEARRRAPPAAEARDAASSGRASGAGDARSSMVACIAATGAPGSAGRPLQRTAAGERVAIGAPRLQEAAPHISSRYDVGAVLGAARRGARFAGGARVASRAAARAPSGVSRAGPSRGDAAVARAGRRVRAQAAPARRRRVGGGPRRRGAAVCVCARRAVVLRLDQAERHAQAAAAAARRRGRRPGRAQPAGAPRARFRRLRLGAQPAPRWHPRPGVALRRRRASQERLERLGTGWMGAIFEWEGVIVEDATEEHKEARARPGVEGCGSPGLRSSDALHAAGVAHAGGGAGQAAAAGLHAQEGCGHEKRAGA